MNKNMKVIGISGYARCGKDTFVAIAKNILKRNGYSPFRIAFADKLKEEVTEMLVTNNFKASVLTDDTEAKKLIRPLLVWWGCQRRRESDGGLYWVKTAEEKIRTYYAGAKYSNIDDDRLVMLVSDVRFPNEARWIHETFNGDVIHLRKYTVQSLTDSPAFVYGLSTAVEFQRLYDEAPNEEEKIQDPIVREMADQRIDWEKSLSTDVLNDSKLNEIVLDALNRTKYFKNTSIGTLL
jgi:hypothetical protein